MHTDSMVRRRARSKKTVYRVTNWPEYECALQARGDVTLWLTPAALTAWTPRKRVGRGGQAKYSNLAIETALTLRLLFRMPLRQSEGFLRAVFGMMGVDLDAPDHTTLSRRSQSLNVLLHGPSSPGPVHLVVDSTGLSVVGQREWSSQKHGQRRRRGWKKLHLGVGADGVVLSQVLTQSNVHDSTQVPTLLHGAGSAVASLTGDGAYDTAAVYRAAERSGARVVVPPRMSAALSGARALAPARERAVEQVRRVGIRRWKREAGYYRQSTAENAFSRYKALFGDRLWARHPEAQRTEAALACNALNRMLELGRLRTSACPA